MVAIEPGEKFTIEYGKGHQIEVVALNGRQRIEATKCVAEMQRASKEGDIDAQAKALEWLEQVTRFCAPSMTDEMIDKTDDELQIQIISQTMMKASIEVEEAKKSG